MKRISFISFFIAVGATILLSSCEDEAPGPHAHEAENSRIVNLSDIPHLQQAIRNRRANTAAKNARDYLSLADSTNIIEFTNPDKSKTYTFSLNIEEKDTLTNLLVTERGTKFEYVLAEYYSPSLNDWMKSITQNTYPATDVETRFTRLEYDDATTTDGGQLCVEFMLMCPSGQHHGGQEGECIYERNTWSFTVLTIPCDDNTGGGNAGGGDDGGGDDWGGDNGGGNSGGGSVPGGGNNSGSNNGTIITRPNIKPSKAFVVTLTPQQLQYVFDYANRQIVTEITHYLDGNQYSPQSQDFAIEIINFYITENISDSDGFKEKIKQAIANGITTTAELSHKIFKKFSQLAEDYPSSTPYINTVLGGINDAAATVTDTNPQTCSFADLFNMWLFELGSDPINFNGNTETTEQLKTQEGVTIARNNAIAQIQNGTFNNVSYQWQYGQGEFYDGMANGNLVTAFLGTYTTTVSITSTQFGYQLNFHVWNTSGWESATRFRIDNDNNGWHDGIFPNTNRDNTNDLSMGGNFTQHWYWSEPIN